MRASCGACSRGRCGRPPAAPGRPSASPGSARDRCPRPPGTRPAPARRALALGPDPAGQGEQLLDRRVDVLGRRPGIEAERRRRRSGRWMMGVRRRPRTPVGGPWPARRGSPGPRESSSRASRRTGPWSACASGPPARRARPAPRASRTRADGERRLAVAARGEDDDVPGRCARQPRGCGSRALRSVNASASASGPNLKGLTWRARHASLCQT